MMKGRPLIIASISCAVIFALSIYWYRTTSSDDGHLQSLSNILSPLTPASSSSKHVAAIIETRPLKTLIPLILHFASVLGPEWPIIFMTRPSTIGALDAFGGGSAPFKRLIKSGQIRIIDLPTGEYMKNYLGISHFLASSWFWDQMGSAEDMLLFQTDSVLCSNSGRSIEEFLGYSFIGAAHPFRPDGFNGGLSLRNVAMSKHVIEKYDIADDVNMGNDLGLYEDLWFVDKMHIENGTFPTRERAGEFAVDFIWTNRTFGFHGINKGQQEGQTEEIYAWCPEAFLAATQDIVMLNEEEQQKNTSNFVGDPESPGGQTLAFD